MPTEVPPCERDTRPDIHPGLRKPKLYDTQYSHVYAAPIRRRRPEPEALSFDDEAPTGDYDVGELAILLDIARRANDGAATLKPQLELDFDETFTGFPRRRRDG